MGASIAYIKTKNLEKNYSLLLDKYAENKKIIAIVKANAYGHGAIEISNFLENKNISYLGVANLDEALELKKNRSNSKILIMGSITNEEILKAIELKIEFTIYDFSQIKFLNKIRNIKINFHIKIDTGMNRLGLSKDEIAEAANIFSNNKNFVMKGIYTHFAEADKKRSAFTKKQISIFKDSVKYFKKSISTIEFIHASNSSGIINYEDDFFNTIRPGLFIYGLSNEKNLKPVMSLMTKVIKIRELSRGDSVSYGRTFIAKRKMKIAVVPLGYADGLPRSLSNKGYLFCKGNKCKIVGRVCMDLTMIDVTNIKNIRIGSNITIFDDKNQTATDIAKMIQTIPYDIVCGISKRVTRLHI